MTPAASTPPAGSTGTAPTPLPPAGSTGTAPADSGKLEGRKVSIKSALTFGSITVFIVAAIVCFTAIPVLQGAGLIAAISIGTLCVFSAAFITGGPGFEVFKSLLPEPKRNKKKNPV